MDLVWVICLNILCVSYIHALHIQKNKKNQHGWEKTKVEQNKQMDLTTVI